MSPLIASRRLRILPALALASTLALSLSAGSTAVAETLSPQELIKDMEAAQRDLHTLAADFVQTSRVKLFKQELRSEGRLLYERPREPSAQPSRLCWEYLRPDPSQMVLIGNQAILHMGDKKSSQPPQVFDMERDPNLRAIFSQLRLWLGLGSDGKDGSETSAVAAFGDEYELRVGGAPAKQRPALLLFARAGAGEGGASTLSKTFSRVELHLDGKSFQLLRLLLVEQSGDEKEIVFTHIQRNVALPAGAFDLAKNLPPVPSPSAPNSNPVHSSH
jgi:outer membrane lipoprotein-sorting protein